MSENKDSWYELKITCQQSITNTKTQPLQVAINALELAGYSVFWNEVNVVQVETEETR